MAPSNSNSTVATNSPENTNRKEIRPPNERQESAHEYGGQGLDASPKTPTKKAKRKLSKKGIEEDTTQEPKKEKTSTSRSLSYADAVKVHPAEVKKREEEAQPEDPQTKPEFHPGDDGSPVQSKQTNGSAKGKSVEATTDKNVEQGESNGSPAGDTTYAEVVKQEPSDDGKTNGQAKKDSSSVSNTSQADSVIKAKDSPNQLDGAASQASTTVDYPGIPEKDMEDGKERQQERAKAPEGAGIRWAPIGVPFKRRLQTAAVLFHCLGIATAMSFFFLFCAIPLFWPIIIIYLVSILFATDATDGKLQKRKEWFRRLPIWTYFADYFPAQLHKTHDLVPTRKYIFGYHPHGIISHGAWIAFASDALGFSEKFPGITNSLLTLDSNFRLPLYREYVFAMGVLSVSKESITNILTRGGRNNEGMGRAVTIVVGGARESLEARPKTMRLIINERKGFIKLALRTGADLVPVLAFGENELYDQLDPHEHPWLLGFQRHVLKVWKFTIPLLHGRGIFNYDVGMMPYRRPMNIVVGKPIKIVQQDNPDNAEVDRLHTLYTQELQEIWDRYKDEFATHRKEEMQFLD